MTTFGDMVFQLGGLPVMSGIPFSQNSQYYFVDPANGSDTNDGKAPNRAFASTSPVQAGTTWQPPSPGTRTIPT
jgi:hypothetical protein